VYRLAIAEAERSPDAVETLNARRFVNRHALEELLARAQAASILDSGDPSQMMEQFSALLWGDLLIRSPVALCLKRSHRPLGSRSRQEVDCEPHGFISSEHLVWLPSGSPLACRIVAFSDPEFIDFASRPHCCHQPAGALAPSRPGFGGLRIAILRQYARIFPTWLPINQPGIGLTHNIHAAIENSQALLEFVPFRPDPGRQYRGYLLVKQPEIIQRHQFQLELIRQHVAPKAYPTDPRCIIAL
jgi:hypothetical protein